MREELQIKYNILKELILSYGKVAVAFSGGVDSTLLIKIANDILGDNAIAVTAFAPYIPEREKNESTLFCQENNIKHVILTLDGLSIPGFKDNPKDRCYICKKEIFNNILATAKEHGIVHVLEGSNVSDLGDYRPGLKALEELHIDSPLRDAGLTKEEIRELSKELNLDTWSKPSYACLASRFPYGEEITKDKLSMVEKAEDYLIAQGIETMRVRIHGTMARIEVTDDDMLKLMEPDFRHRTNRFFKELGFSYVTIDMQGFRSGSMNEVLK